MAEYIERETTCGDCIHACLCEHDASIPLFNRENKAYCGNFFPADVEPVRHATWKLEEFQVSPFDTDQVLICTQCGFVHQHDAWFNRCPNCGARMDLEVSE